MAAEHSSAFAPGRVNLIGEHTDYNRGLALAFAIAEGVTVHASHGGERIEVRALDLGERDEFSPREIQPMSGWRAFPRGVVAELARAGLAVGGALVEITGDVPRGSGLSSSAALEVALALALAPLAQADAPARRALSSPLALARLCSRVENEWAGARTGLLDQLACLCGEPDRAMLIDFDTLDVRPVALALADWRLVVLDSGERHAHASSGYNQRRTECATVCERLGVASLRELDDRALGELPEPLRRRARHVLEENRRVLEAVAALQDGDMPALGALLDASHASLRDLYEVSTPRVEATVERLRGAGAAGARIVGGGFGGAVLALFAPGVQPPPEAREVHPAAGAHTIAT